MEIRKRAGMKYALASLAACVVIGTAGMAMAATASLENVKATCDGTGKVTVTGTYNDGTSVAADKQVTMKVNSLAGSEPDNIVAIDQAASVTDGKFNFSFKLKDATDDPQAYKLSVGGESIDTPKASALFKSANETNNVTRVVIIGPQIIKSGVSVQYKAIVYNGKKVISVPVAWDSTSGTPTVNPDGTVSATADFTLRATAGSQECPFPVKVISTDPPSKPDVTTDVQYKGLYNELYTGGWVAKQVLTGNSTLTIPSISGATIDSKLYDAAGNEVTSGDSSYTLDNNTLTNKGLPDGKYRLSMAVKSGSDNAFQQNIFFGVVSNSTLAGDINSAKLTVDVADRQLTIKVDKGTIDEYFIAPASQVGKGLPSSSSWKKITPDSNGVITLSDTTAYPDGDYVISVYVGNRVIMQTITIPSTKSYTH